MKLRWRILYILLGSLFLLPSCTDEDLDTTMYGGREDTEFYNNLEEINQALTACYFYMKDSWNDMSLELMFINDCASDDCEKGGSGLTNEGDIYQLETFNIFTTNSKVSQFWNMAYRAIYQINTLLDKTIRRCLRVMKMRRVGYEAFGILIWLICGVMFLCFCMPNSLRIYINPGHR